MVDDKERIYLLVNPEEFVQHVNESGIIPGATLPLAFDSDAEAGACWAELIEKFEALQKEVTNTQGQDERFQRHMAAAVADFGDYTAIVNPATGFEYSLRQFAHQACEMLRRFLARGVTTGMTLQDASQLLASHLAASPQNVATAYNALGTGSVMTWDGRNMQVTTRR